MISVLRRVPRLVNKRGRVKAPQHEEETSENLLLHKVREDGNDSQRKEQTSDGVENLTEKMKELKLFPKLEFRRRHLKQVLRTWFLLLQPNFNRSLRSSVMSSIVELLWINMLLICFEYFGQFRRFLYVGTA